MTSPHQNLAPILRAFQTQSATAFSFQGENFALPSEAEAESTLSNLIYERCYMRRIDSPAASTLKGETSPLTADLCAANTSRPRWQAGWCIEATENSGWITASRDGLTRAFAPGEYITKEGPGMPLRTGAMVDVYFAVESHYMQPGFYFAFGETVDPADSGCLLRFYWNLNPDGAPLLLHSLSTLLNRFQVPFRFKCLIQPGAYVRTDSAVLYISRRWYQITARLLRTAHRSVESHLRADAPLFTKPLAVGLALAEDPGGNQSFGMHRSRALAKAMLGPSQGSLTVADIEKRLGEQGVSLAAPYLNPGSADIYDFVS